MDFNKVIVTTKNFGERLSTEVVEIKKNKTVKEKKRTTSATATRRNAYYEKPSRLVKHNFHAWTHEGHI